MLKEVNVQDKMWTVYWHGRPGVPEQKWPKNGLAVLWDEDPVVRWHTLWEQVLSLVPEVARHEPMAAWPLAKLMVTILGVNPAMGNLSCVLDVPTVEEMMQILAQSPVMPKGPLNCNAAWDVLEEHMAYVVWQIDRLEAWQALALGPEEMEEEVQAMAIPFTAQSPENIYLLKQMASMALTVVDEWSKRLGPPDDEADD